MIEFGNLNDTTDILIMTDPEFVPWVEEMAASIGLKVLIMTLESIVNIFFSAAARLYIFNYPRINEYDRILYLDTDIIVSDDINRMLTLPIDNKLYALQEGTIENEWWGGPRFFDFTQVDKTTTAFSTCTLLFNNCPEVRLLFAKIHVCMLEKLQQGENYPITLEQPFVIYVAVMEKMYDNQLFHGYITNHPEAYTGHVISHFPIGPGDYTSKLKKMNIFYEILRKARNPVDTRNLIYLCVFYNKNYIHLLKLCLQSMIEFGNLHENTDILIFTDSTFKESILEMTTSIGLAVDIMEMANIYNIFLAANARNYIYAYPKIDKYDKILYLDTDIIVSSDLNRLFSINLEAKLYTMCEGTIESPWYGGHEFFDFTTVDKDTKAFSTCVLLFKNCDEMKYFFVKLHQNIWDIYPKLSGVPITLEQPFVIYTAVTENLYNNGLLGNNIIVNHPEAYVGQVISHFPIGPGDYTSKLIKMNVFNEILHNAQNQSSKLIEE
jgi:lipopolysaccharide biosynthesis glycosyltransferase